MDVHHFSVGAMRPYGGALFDGRTPGLAPADLVCHCLLLETSVGLILVDTGLVAEDTARSAERISPFFRITDRVSLPAEQAAVNHIRRLGRNPGDVRHVILTHLDFDHVGGLPDFPGAAVHLSRREAEAARRAHMPKERARYRTANAIDQSNWRLYDPFPAEFFGLPASYLDGIPGLMLVWLPGHTKGHCGVAMDLGRGQWLLHAGDAIFNGRELDPDRPSMPTGARLYQWFMEASQAERRHSLAQLRRIRRDGSEHVTIICTHDPAILARSGIERTTVWQRSPGTGG
jgi:glyoxylase-like metal-dependent hydrolase (beta-lactamase superfamily II)